MKKIAVVLITFFTSLMLFSCSFEGATGATGPQGVQGEVGPTGPQGEKGETGATGPQGSSGKDGKDGIDGKTPYIGIDGCWWIGNIDTGISARGEDGKDGEDGINGIDGTDGNMWYFGSTDPSNTIGNNNDFYLNNKNWNIYQKSNNTWILVGNIKGQDGENGDQGVAGIDGVTWLTGNINPSNDSGNNGDLYLNIISFDIFTKRDNMWMLLGNIKGQDANHANEILTVTFDVNGGTLPEDCNSSIEVCYGDTLDLPLPTKENYIFKGWVTGFSENDGQYTTITPVMNNITLYAKWEINSQYTIFFETNGGNPINEELHFADENITTLPDAVKIDKSFIAWYLDAGLTNRVAYPLKLSSNITLYAAYKDAEYTITFDSNDGISIDAKTCAPGTGIDLPICEKEDYVFKGWYKDSTLEIAAGDTIEVHSNMTLYAKWEIKKYTISFATDNGDFISDKAYITGTAIYELPTPNREDYIFKGWYKDSSFNNKVTYPFAIADDMVVYAKWTANFTGISTYEGLTAITNMYSNYKLLCNIDCKGRDIKPIGTYSSPFRGVFNGNGYTISNYTITTSKESTNSDNSSVIVSGLFGCSYGTIKNVKFENFNIQLDITSNDQFVYVGGIVGANFGNIIQCGINGLFDVKAYRERQSDGELRLCCGGICGKNNNKIINSCFYGNITTYCKTHRIGSSTPDWLSFLTETYVGGIAGLADNSSFINKCISGFNASIETYGEYGLERRKEYIGGICGYNKVDISQCLFLYGNLISTSLSSSSSIPFVTGCSENGNNARKNNVYYGPELTFDGKAGISKSNINSSTWYRNYLGLSDTIWDLSGLNYDGFIYPKLK